MSFPLGAKFTHKITLDNNEDNDGVLTLSSIYSFITLSGNTLNIEPPLNEFTLVGTSITFTLTVECPHYPTADT